MILSKQKLKLFLLIILISILLLYSYRVQTQPMNAYIGMVSVEYDYLYMVNLIASIVILYLIFPNYFYTPTNIFISIYILFPLLSIISHYGVSGLLNTNSYWILFLFQVLSISFIQFLSRFIRYFIYRFNFKLFFKKKGRIKNEWVFVCFLFAILLLLIQRFELDFGFVNSYDRRLNVRNELSGVLAYMTSIGMNGVAPFLAYISALNKKSVFFIIAFLFVVIMFGITGAKAPIALVIFMWIFGKLTPNYGPVKILIYAVLIISVVSVFEFLLFDYSLGMDIFLRRVFSSVALTQSYYADYFLNHAVINDIVFGVAKEGKDVTYMIGELYSNNPNANDNTNLLLYEIGRRGLVGYVFMLFFLSFFFSFLDVLYIKCKMKEMAGVSILYSLIIVEQSYTVALISSGILFIVIASLLNNNKVID
jgi:hypothetical protein